MLYDLEVLGPFRRWYLEPGGDPTVVEYQLYLCDGAWFFKDSSTESQLVFLGRQVFSSEEDALKAAIAYRKIEFNKLSMTQSKIIGLQHKLDNKLSLAGIEPGILSFDNFQGQLTDKMVELHCGHKIHVSDIGNKLPSCLACALLHEQTETDLSELEEQAISIKESYQNE